MGLLSRQAKNAVGALLTGLLFNLAFPPYNLGLLVFIALVPWFLSLRRLSNGKQAFRSGYFLGFLIWGVQMWWVVTLTGRWVGNATLGLIPLLIACILGSLYFGLLGVVIYRSTVKGWLWAIPILWTGIEMFRSFIPQLGYPYFLISTPLWPFPWLTQSAFVGTQYLVSCWVVAINVLAFIAMARAEKPAPEASYSFPAARKMLIPVILIFAGSLLRSIQPVLGEPHKLTAGQPGVDLAFSNAEDEMTGLTKSVAQLYAEARNARSELLVLPEGIAEATNDDPPMAEFILENSPPVLFGGKRHVLTGSIPPTQDKKRGSEPIYQSAFGYDGNWNHADKARLVVFGEFVPFRGILPGLDSFKLPTGDLTPAEKTQAIKVGGFTVGPLVCFEGLFFDVAQKQVENGAQFLAVIAIDDWYMGSGAPDHLRASSVWRAVETGLPMVRAGGLGYSMIVDQRGRLLREAELGKTEALTATLYIESKPANSPLRPLIAWSFLAALPVLSALVWKRPSWRKSKTNPAS